METKLHNILPAWREMVALIRNEKTHTRRIEKKRKKKAPLTTCQLVEKRREEKSRSFNLTLAVVIKSYRSAPCRNRVILCNCIDATLLSSVHLFVSTGRSNYLSR